MVADGWQIENMIDSYNFTECFVIKAVDKRVMIY